MKALTGPVPRSETYLTALFQQYLVILAQCHAKDDRRNILETVNPLLPLTALPADVKHATLCQLATILIMTGFATWIVLLDAQLSHLEPSLVYTGSLCPRSKDVHLAGQVVWSDYPLSMLEEAVAIQVSPCTV